MAGTRLYVGNLSFSTSEETLRQAFEQGGHKVVEVKIGGNIGDGSPDSNLRAVKLCDQKVPGSCLPVSVPNP